MNLAAILQALHQRPIAYYPVYTKVAGSVTGGILLSQLLYWWGHYGRKFHKGDEELRHEVALSVREFREAKAKLKTLPFLAVTREGLPATTWYEVNADKLGETLAESVQTSSYKTQEISEKLNDENQIHMNGTLRSFSVPTSLNTVVQTSLHTVVPTITEIDSETDKEEKTPLFPQQGEDEFSAPYLRFWKIYPVKKNKDKAWQVWRRRKLDKQADQIIVSVEWHQKTDKDWARGFIPHPTTFLNGGGWKDELPTQQSQAQHQKRILY